MGQAIYVYTPHCRGSRVGSVCSGGTKGCTSSITDSDVRYSNVWGGVWVRRTWMDEFRHVHILFTAIVASPSHIANISLIQFRHISELEVGLQFLPVLVFGPIACVLAVYLLPRVPTYIIFGASMVSFCVGQLLMALTPPEQTYWAMTFPTTAIVTFGPDLAFASASLIASDAVPNGLQGVAGSFINTVVNYSIAIGLALAGAVETGVNRDGSDPLKGYRGAWWLGTGFAGLGILITAIFYKGMSKKHKHE
jgi:MFS family permease